MEGSQAVNKKFKGIEQEHAQPLSQVMAGDESSAKKRKFEGLFVLKDIVHTENKGVGSRTRSHSKSKLVAKDPKIGTISRPIDSNDIMEMDPVDCNDIELDSDKEEEANTNVTTDTWPRAPEHQERTRKRKSFSDTDTRGLVDCIAEASELAKKAMTELDEMGKELQATRGEVAQLKEASSVTNAQHAAEVRRLADEHHKALVAHGEEAEAERASVVAKLQEEHAAAVAQLTEHLKKEHAAAIARLKEKHAAEVGRLADDKTRLKEEHAADVARIKDAADKEVQDAKKNIVLGLFPKLDVSLLNDDQSLSSRDLAAAGTPKAQGRS